MIVLLSSIMGMFLPLISEENKESVLCIFSCTEGCDLWQPSPSSVAGSGRLFAAPSIPGYTTYTMDIVDQELERLHCPDPGPRDPFVLTMEDSHRSKRIWDNDENAPKDYECLHFRRVETKLRRGQLPCEAIMQLVRRAGLEGLLRVPFIQLDRGLLTALIERWRPETDTFHMGEAEMAVTLQDVEVILGLPVHGEAVTGNCGITDIPGLCTRLLGLVPDESELKGQKLMLRWLDRFNGQVNEEDNDEVVRQKARGFILRLLGGTIFADHSGTQVHLCWLTLLEDFDVAGWKSWGSAALGWLYYRLCHGARDAKEVTGPMVLLQIWAWERLPILSPRRVGNRVGRVEGAPLIAKWDDDFTMPDVAKSVVGHYRHALDILRPEQVNWTSYDDELIDSLPAYCSAGRAIWRAHVPLICFATVEMHQPERVRRQFGRRQHIPPTSEAVRLSHGKTLRNGPNRDWRNYHRLEVDRWDGRLGTVDQFEEHDLEGIYPFIDPYVIWYKQITRRYITRNGAATDGANRCFDLLRQPGLPQLTSQQMYELGTIGLQYLAKLQTHVRKDLPIHGVYEVPPAPVPAQQVVDEVEQVLEQHGVDVPFEDDEHQGEFEVPQQQHQPQQQEQQSQPNEDQPEVVPSQVQTGHHVENQSPIYTPDLLFSTDMFSDILHSSNVSTGHDAVDWAGLDVQRVADPTTTFDDSALQLRRNMVGESSLGTQGEGDGDMTQVSPIVEQVAGGEGPEEGGPEEGGEGPQEDGAEEGAEGLEEGGEGPQEGGAEEGAEGLEEGGAGAGEVEQDGAPHPPLRRSKGIAENSHARVPRRTHRIPGPAGDLEDVLARRAAGEGTETMNTQEFIHRALNVASEDTDFVNNSAWLTALTAGYLQDAGYIEMANVKKVKRFERLPLVVGLIKSCVRGELGDYAAELKDLHINISFHLKPNFAGLLLPNMHVVVHVEGKIIESQQGPQYRGGRRITMSIERGITFDTFKEMIINKISAMEITIAYLLPTLSYPNPTYSFTTIEVVDDGGVELIFDMADAIPGYIPQIFTTAVHCQTQNNRQSQNPRSDGFDDQHIHEDHSFQHDIINSSERDFVNTDKDDEYESSFENVDQHLGEDGDDVDIDNGINDVRIFEAPSTIMTRDTWTNVLDPTPAILRTSNLGWDGTSELFKGQVFLSKLELQRTTERYSMDRNVMYCVDQSTKKLLVLKCKNEGDGGTCNWRLRATRKDGEEEWKITKYEGPHSCLAVSITPDHRMLTARYISSRILNLVREDPSLKIKVLQASVRDTTGGYNPSYDKTWLGKQIAIESIFGDWDQSYEKLPRYLAAVQHFNPGTEFKINTVPSVIPGTVIFDQVFWAFASAIEGFRHCRPVLCVDGTFLTGKYKGVMLIVVSQDAENQLFPIAFAVVERETKESWGWFLDCLRCYVTQRTGLCLISDRHHGLVNYAKDEPSWRPPYAYHRYCARHIRANYVRRHGQVAGRQVFCAATEIQPRKFERELNKTKRFIVTDGPNKGKEKVYDDLMAIPLERWSFAHDGGMRYGSKTTNVVECFNGVLKDARHLPITAMVMTTFFKSVEYFNDKVRKSLARMDAGHVYSEFASTKYDTWRQKSRRHTVVEFNKVEGIYTVQTPVNPTSPYKGNHLHVVKLNEGTCTCNKLQQWKIPCSHVIAICTYHNLDPLQYFSDYWKLESNIAMYSSLPFQPVYDEEYWPNYFGDTIVPDKDRLRGKGRPRYNRIRNEMDDFAESQPSQKQSCKLCGQVGHNRRTCPLTRGGASSSEPTNQ
ncbi:hypothetical protein Vadar_013718 [Vaccinium darrowii]|uniref:Uncharacterized protein n=1 Tax=Vaccinium darrowii TaxID=229202 RepID=A0ACB7YML4_9ERIC|nr:hypothetical protein Vadar_013718 [Vaccinium darrowii]